MTHPNNNSRPPYAHSANIGMVKQALIANPIAASTFRNLSQLFVVEVIVSARAGFSGQHEQREAAAKRAQQAEDAAHALIVGLMLEYMPDWDKWKASEAATDYNRPYFDRKAMFCGTSAEPKRVFMSLEAVDAYTLQVAPHRVLMSHNDTTLYLFSEADARLFTERTGSGLTPYHTI